METNSARRYLFTMNITCKIELEATLGQFNNDQACPTLSYSNSTFRHVRNFEEMKEHDEITLPNIHFRGNTDTRRVNSTTIPIKKGEKKIR